MLPRGYKSWCENTSLSIRKRLDLKKTDPLDPRILAKSYDVKLLTPNDINGLSGKSKNLLLGKAKSDWSAVTIYSDDSELIIYNPEHVYHRQSSDIMHELAHIIKGHSPARSYFLVNTNIVIRQHDVNQEDEAVWLSDTLLLPKNALIAIKYGKMSSEEVRLKYFVSKKLLDKRLNVTGVNAMYARAKTKKY